MSPSTRAPSLPGATRLTARAMDWLGRRLALSEAGGEASTLRLHWLRDRAEFRLGAAEYRIRREGLRGPFVLEGEGRRLARARKPGLRRRFDVVAGDRRYTLRAVGWLRPRYRVLHGDRQVGEIRPAGLFRFGARADLPGDLPGPIRVFLVFLPLVAWRRARRAAA